MRELQIRAGKLAAVVLPELAGRIASLEFAGRPILAGPDVHPDNWGSTYWTSPQSTWGWPPVAGIDSAPFEVLSEAPIALRGPHAGIGGTELRLEKRVSVASRQDALLFEYELSNVGQATLGVAGWQISRVGPGGLSFFQTGESELTPVAPHAALRPLYGHGHSFFDHRSFVPGKSAKLHADARGGYLAHVLAAEPNRSRLLFLKRFEDTHAAEQAPGEGEVEIFSNEDGRYVEVEVQGRFAPLEPGQRQVFRVEWSVHELPEGLEPSPDSLPLIEFVRSLC